MNNTTLENMADGYPGSVQYGLPDDLMAEMEGILAGLAKAPDKAADPNVALPRVQEPQKTQIKPYCSRNNYNPYSGVIRIL